MPDGNDGKEVQISSEGDFYNGCPDTDGVFWTEIYPNYGNSLHRPTEITLDGKKYEQATNPSLFMHANSGITFDLDNIRQANSSLRISDFTAFCGIVDKAKDGIGAEPLVDFIVLLDGDEKYRKNGVKAGDGADAINIKIENHNRFLTLMVTDGGNGHTYDWGLFARPMLVTLE